MAVVGGSLRGRPTQTGCQPLIPSPQAGYRPLSQGLGAHRLPARSCPHLGCRHQA